MSITSKLDLTNMFARLKNFDQKDEVTLSHCFSHKRRPFSVCVPKTKDDEENAMAKGNAYLHSTQRRKNWATHKEFGCNLIFGDNYSENHVKLK
jgi:hypothetical protein